MRTVEIFSWVGTFAENKEQGKKIRTKILLPTLRKGEEVVLDFSDVNLATQSFIHALIAEAVRDKQFDALKMMAFSHCNDNIRAVIEVVVAYCQDDWGSSSEPDGIATAD